MHATRPGLDQTLNFENRKLRKLEGHIDMQGSGRWNVFLQTGDWRLTGSLHYPQTDTVSLTPNYIRE